MKVVANTTPLISLASIGKLELLKDIFGEIIVADAVYNEIKAKQSKVMGTMKLILISSEYRVSKE